MMLHKKLSVFLIILGLGILSSCSIKTAYKQMDWILAGMVEDYVTLTDFQEADVEKRIDAFLTWHQFSQLKIYADDLQQIQQYTSMGLDDANAEDVYKRFMASLKALNERAAPDLAEVMMTFDAEQQQELLEKLAEQNKEIEDEYKEYTEAERLDRAGDKLIENFERWLGDLQPQQEETLRTWPPQFKPLDEERMAFRLKWQAALKELFAKAMPFDQKRDNLIMLIKTPEAYQTEEHKQKLVYNSKLLKKLVLDFDRTVTTEQRGFLAGRLDYLIVNFRELAAEQSSK